mmetsp:Transcript_4033/g.8049  ORF Transcript_4033/g.8049 Transcript_4033/m.8049 type:complete len:85 (-) Transcript_4033:61-315(-)
MCTTRSTPYISVAVSSTANGSEQEGGSSLIEQQKASYYTFELRASNHCMRCTCAVAHLYMNVFFLAAAAAAATTPPPAIAAWCC